MPATTDTLYRLTLRRALAANNLANLPLHFAIEVMDRYRGAKGYSVIRSNTVGRVRKEGGWTLDFGFVDGEAMVHICLGDLQRLPDEERDHWVSFATIFNSSESYLQMRLTPGSCFDDGEIRPWD